MNGAFSTAVTVAMFTVLAFRPPRPRHSAPFTMSFALSWWMNELPFIGFWWLAAGTTATLLHPLPTPWWWVVAGLVALDIALLARILLRARSAHVTLAVALRDAYGPAGTVDRSPTPWWRVVLVPLVSWRTDVRRIGGVRYGPARRGNRLDVYARRPGRVRRPGRGNAAAHRRAAPVFVYFHGGGLDGSGFGSRTIFAHALPYRLASRGWVCVSADYRMHGVGYEDQLADVRAALEWVREHAAELGGDPQAVFAAGGSSGANLATTAVLSGTVVAGVIGLYGFYGAVGARLSPHACVNAGAPPFLIVHGALDALVPREDARAFADHLKRASSRPVVYAELPGANHNFDLFPSVRLASVADAVDRFAELASRPEGAHVTR